VSVPAYAFGIAGDQWGKQARVNVTLLVNRVVERIAVVTTATGAFVIGVSAYDPTVAP
jgi:hypothetical protein